MTLLSTLAARTERLRLGLMVTSNRIRLPALLAKIATTVDHVSGGRLDMGIGGGSRPDHPLARREYAAHGLPFQDSADAVSTIVGGSYGGYAALVGVTVAPEKFAARRRLRRHLRPRELPRHPAPARAGDMTTNWIADVDDLDDPAQLADMRARSPIIVVDRLRTPLLVAQGANDIRVVQAESDNIVAPLRERGVSITYLVADDEGHGFENPENQVLLLRAVERHFAEHLGRRSA